MNEDNLRVCRRASKALLKYTDPVAHLQKSAPARALFLSKWQSEQAARFHRLFSRIDSALAQGGKLTKLLRAKAEYYRHGRRYRCDQGRIFKAPYGTLVRKYYAWRAGGRSPQALLPRYIPGKSRVPEAQIRDFARCCVAPGVRSMAAAFRSMAEPGATYSCFMKRLPPAKHRRIRAIFHVRRDAHAAEQRANKMKARAENIRGV